MITFVDILISISIAIFALSASFCFVITGLRFLNVL